MTQKPSHHDGKREFFKNGSVKWIARLPTALAQKGRALQGHGQAVACDVAAAVGALGRDSRTRAAQHQVVAGKHRHAAVMLLAYQALALALLLVQNLHSTEEKECF